MSKTLSPGLDPILSMADNGNYLPLLAGELESLIVELKSFSSAYGAKAKGKLTLTVDLASDRFGAIDMTASHAIKLPKMPAAKAILWATEDGRLSPDNPNQKRMEVREVGGKRDLRFADDE